MYARDKSDLSKTYWNVKRKMCGYPQINYFWGDSDSPC